MTRLEKAGIRVHDFLWKNTGNDDWPVRIECDEDVEGEFCAVMNELGEAVEEVKPGSKPWPV